SNDVTFDLADDIDVASVTAGNSKLDTDGLTVNDGTNTATYGAGGVEITGGANGPVSLTDSGLDNGNNKIVNVAAGDVSATSTDAVNGSQLNKQGSSIADALGGGSTDDAATGTVIKPSYNVYGGNVDNVGDAITDL